MPHQDRLVILHFLTGGAVNATSTTTVAPYHHPAAQIRDYLEKQGSQLILHASQRKFNKILSDLIRNQICSSVLMKGRRD